MRALGGLLLLLLLCGQALAAPADEEEKPWWEKRKPGTDLYYPHALHEPVMQARGDPCLRCHPFTPVPAREPAQVRQLEAIANEPLRAICHQCHVVERTAADDCRLCHHQPESIWPADHAFDYRHRHAAAAREDAAACRACHLDLEFCTDCHLRRDTSRHRAHDLGYLGRHGLEARFDPASCAACHVTGFCRDCHEARP